MAYPGGAPVTIVGGQAGGATAGTAANPLVITGGGSSATPQPVMTAAAATGTPTQVAVQAASFTILASNAARRGATVYYDGPANLSVLLRTGGTASATVLTCKLGATGLYYYEVPYGFTGAIIGFGSTASGTVSVTEVTA